MTYLPNTVALVGWWTDPDRLGWRARDVLDASDAAIFISPINVWEIANKNRIGKLPEVIGFEAACSDLARENAFTILPLTNEHAMRAGYLPADHRDPFDRLLAGQALVEDMTVLTSDPQIAAFGCKVLWS